MMNNVAALEDKSRKEALRRIQAARTALLMRLPFLASALFQIDLQLTDEPVIGGFVTDGTGIVMSSLHVRNTDDAHLRADIVHVLLHVLFEHVERRGKREAEIWNRACDYAVNAVMFDFGFSFDAGALVEPVRFKDMTAEEICERLNSSGGRTLAALKAFRQGSAPSSGIVAGQASPSDLAYDQAGGSDSGRLVNTEAVNGENDGNVDTLQGTGLSSGLSSDDRRQLRAAVREQVLREAEASRSCGQNTESLCEALRRTERRHVDWRTMLRELLRETVRDDFRLWPPSKRHLWRGLSLPSVGSQTVGTVVVAADTSGSMKSEDIAAILSEVLHFRDTVRCTLRYMEFDCALQRVFRWEAFDTPDVAELFSIKGRGGTDFRPVFDAIEKSADGPPAVLIIGTDGFGAFPEYAPDYPVVCLNVFKLFKETHPQRFPPWVIVIPYYPET